MTRKARPYNVVSLTCLECGHVFKRSTGRMHGVHCPKCKSLELELSAWQPWLVRSGV